MGLLWEDRAWEEYLYWQTQDRKTLKRINAIVRDIQRNPSDGIGKAEPLRGNLSGWWSMMRRIVLFIMSKTGLFTLLSVVGITKSNTARKTLIK